MFQARRVPVNLTGCAAPEVDEASLIAQFASQSDRDDFKNRMRAATADWADKTGRSITLASSGQAGNVTIKASNDQIIRNKTGEVAPDDANPADSSLSLSSLPAS